MPVAWSYPNFLPDLFEHPAPLSLYDQLYLDQRSYEDLCDRLPTAKRELVISCVESPTLALFELFDAEAILDKKWALFTKYLPLRCRLTSLSLCGH